MKKAVIGNLVACCLIFSVAHAAAETGIAGEVRFVIGEYNALPGQVITVPVQVKNFTRVAGYQFTLAWNPQVLDFVEAVNQSVQGFYGEQLAQNGFLTTSWNEPSGNPVTLNDGAAVFELKFKVVGAAGSVSSITFGSEITPVEAFNQQLKLFELLPANGLVQVGSNSGNHGTANYFSSDIHLHAQPNPFSNATQIFFSIPDDAAVTIQVSDLLGKTVKYISGNYSAGAHQIGWNGNDDSGKQLTSGIYHVRMTAGSYSVSEKIVLVR